MFGDRIVEVSGVVVMSAAEAAVLDVWRGAQAHPLAQTAMPQGNLLAVAAVHRGAYAQEIGRASCRERV